MRRSLVSLAGLAIAVTGAACRPTSGTQRPTPATGKDSAVSPAGMGSTSLPNADPFPSTYVRPASAPLVIKNVNVMTAAGPTIRNGAVAVVDGKIVAVGAT